MHHPFQLFLLCLCAFISALPARAQEVTELGVIPEPKPQAIPITGKPLTGEQIFERSVPSLVFVSVVDRDDQAGFGSGFFASSDGLIVTNAHVVKNGRRIAIFTHDKKTIEYVTVLVRNELLDLAVLKVDGGNYPAVTLASRKPKVGATVYAIGNPSGLTNTLSKGLISGIRPGVAGNLKSNLAADASKENVSNYVIQHTAALSGGSSGGMLLAETGELIGVNTFELADTKDAYFAASAADVEYVLAAARRVLQANRESTEEAAQENAAQSQQQAAQEKPKPKAQSTVKFDFASLSKDAVRQLTDAAPKYAYIGYRLCYTELYDTVETMAQRKGTDEQSRETLAYLKRSDTPLIFSADGKLTWHSVEEALEAMKVTVVKVRVTKIYDDKTLFESPTGMLLINTTYDAKVGDEFKIAYIPGKQAELELAGTTINVDTGSWCYSVRTLTPQQLGQAMIHQKVTNLLTVKVIYQPAKSVVNANRIGNGTEYTAQTTPSHVSQQLIFTRVDLSPSPVK